MTNSHALWYGLSKLEPPKNCCSEKLENPQYKLSEVITKFRPVKAQ